MELSRFITRTSFADNRPRAPRALLYVPPYGSPVSCPDLESAQAAAENYSAENPGRTVAVYQLVGYAFRPIEKPTFTPAESDQAKAELLDVAPSEVDFGDDAAGDHEIDRPDLSPQQRDQLRILREATQRHAEEGE